MKITVKVIGETMVISGLRELSAMDRRNLLENLAEVQKRNIREGVERGEDVNGQRFLPSLRAIRDGGQTLIDAGHMMDAIRPLSVDTKSATLGLGSDLENKKARLHHFGGTIKPLKGTFLKFPGPKGGLWGKGTDIFMKQVTIPARPWFGVRRGDESRLQAAADAWLDQRVRESGL